MPTSLHIQDLTAAEIAELLAKQGHKVPPSLVPDLKLFLYEIDRLHDSNLSGNLSADPTDELEAAA